METKIKSPLPLPVRPITRRHIQHLSLGGGREAIWRQLGRPLFDAGISIFCHARMPSYEMSSEKYISYGHRIFLIIQGEMDVRINARNFTARAGDLVITPMDSLTYRRAHGPLEWIYIDIHNRELWDPLRNCKDYTRPYESAALLYILTRGIFDAKLNPTPFATRCALENSQVLVMLLKRELAFSQNPSGTRLHALTALIDKIRNNPALEWDRAMMARTMNVATRSLTRIFKDNYDQSPKQMLTFIRTGLAARLLANTEKTIATIAEEVGYNSHFALTRAFGKTMGVNPSEYRRKHRQNQKVEP